MEINPGELYVNINNGAEVEVVDIIDEKYFISNRIDMRRDIVYIYIHLKTRIDRFEEQSFKLRDRNDFCELCIQSVFTKQNVKLEGI